MINGMPYFSHIFSHTKNPKRFPHGFPVEAVSFDLPKLANEPCWKRLTRSKKQLGSSWKGFPCDLASWEFVH